MTRAWFGSVLFLVSVIFVHSQEMNGPLFTDITATSGIRFLHNPEVEENYFFPEIMGSGCAFVDFDNDRDLDVYLIGRRTNENRLFRQEVDGKFVEITQKAGVAGSGYGMGVAAGDINNDGFPELYVTNYGPDILYRNNGDGSFTDISRSAGIHNPGWGTSVLFLDFDRDGYLDIFVVRYVVLDPTVICTDRAGKRDYCGPDAYEGQTDQLYRNNRYGTFTDVSSRSGIRKLKGKGLGAVSADFNQDGFPDIYVANDREPNFLWINQGDGTFRNQALPLGVSVNALGRAEASMGVAVGDLNNDALLDLFITNLRDETNTLYLNGGPVGFLDESLSSGLGPPSLPFTGFGTGFFDYDHDGNRDVAVVNGRVIRGPLLVNRKPREFWDDYAEPNLLFQNEGRTRFRNVSRAAGAFGSLIENSRGLAFGDVDQDGDIDLLVSNCGGPARLFRNDSPKRGHWLMVRALDRALKRDAIGAVIMVFAGGKQFTGLIQRGYSYFSSNDPKAHFGLGNADVVDEIRVLWPDGSKETFPGVKADQWITLYKGTGK